MSARADASAAVQIKLFYQGDTRRVKLHSPQPSFSEVRKRASETFGPSPLPINRPLYFGTWYCRMGIISRSVKKCTVVEIPQPRIILADNVLIVTL